MKRRYIMSLGVDAPHVKVAATELYDDGHLYPRLFYAEVLKRA